MSADAHLRAVCKPCDRVSERGAVRDEAARRDDSFEMRPHGACVHSLVQSDVVGRDDELQGPAGSRFSIQLTARGISRFLVGLRMSG